MYHLEQIRTERGAALFKLRFAAALEERYRRSQRKTHRVQHVLLFAILCAGFALGPLTNVQLLHAPDWLTFTLISIEIPIAILTGIAALTPLVRMLQLMRQGLQSAAVLSV